MAEVHSVVLNYLQLSVQAEQVFCSIVTEMEYLPQFSHQAALKTVHEENYETSYHRNTAAGNLLRIADSGIREILVLMTIECFVEARRHEKTAENALQKVTVSTLEDEMMLRLAWKWHIRRRRYLKYAMKALRASVHPDVWEKGIKLAE